MLGLRIQVNVQSMRRLEHLTHRSLSLLARSRERGDLPSLSSIPSSLSLSLSFSSSFRSFSSKNNPNQFGDLLNKVKGEYNEKGEKVEDVKKTTEEGEKKEEESPKERESAQTTTDYGAMLSQALWKTKDFASSFSTGLKETWTEMVQGSGESKIRKTVAHAESVRAKQQATSSAEDEDEENKPPAYEGPTALVVAKSKKSTWEQMSERLSDSPLIREMLKNSRKIGKQAAGTDLGKQAKRVSENISNKIHDAREFWETTQNPLVYKLSGAWESLTSPTEEGMAIGEIQRLDPDFIKEEWAEEVKREITPKIIKAHIEGDLKTLKPRLGEAVYNKLAADIRMRKADGLTIDPRVLDIDEMHVLVRHLETEGPLILVVYMVQQINCIRNREGEIVEGGESNVVAKFYTLAFKQVYNDDEGIADWKIVDYELSGGETYF